MWQCSAGVNQFVLLHGKVSGAVNKNSILFLLYHLHISLEQFSCKINPLLYEKKQKIKTVEQFLEGENVEVKTWPSQSSYISPNENIWKIISDNVRARKPMIMTDLQQKLQEEWDKTTPGQCVQLVKSFHGNGNDEIIHFCTGYIGHASNKQHY